MRKSPEAQAIQRLQRWSRQGTDWPTGFDEELRDFYYQSGLEERAIGMHHAWDGLDRRPSGYDYLGAWGT